MTDQTGPIVDENHAPNVLLMGEVSSGKTRSIRTLVDAGVEVFLIATEPNFADVLGDIPPDKLHWTYIKSYPETMAQLEATVKMLQSYDMEAIKKMPGQDRGKYTQFMELIGATNNFHDERTGKDYGDVMKFTPQQALVIDGLSGINNMAARLVAGNKPCMSWPEFEASQFCIEQFINTIAQACSCWFVLTAHLERETDPITSMIKLMPSTIGKALAPKIPKFFSEMILCRRTLQGNTLKWTWDNMTTDANVKFRNLPPSQALEPDFRLIKKNWEAKVEFLK